MFSREEKVPQFRLTMVQYAILVVFLILAFGLWRLQVGRSDYYSSLAEQNRIKQVPILAPRGKILDREGRIIVDNYPSFSVLLEYYKSAQELITLIDDDSQPALWALVEIYRQLMEKIVARKYDVFSERVRLTTSEKLRVLGKGFVRRLT